MSELKGKGVSTPHKVKATHIFTKPNGDSSIGTVDIAIDQANKLGMLSEQFASKFMLFRYTAKDYHLDWHCAPRRQFIICLDAAVEVEASDGTTAVVPTGGVLLVEDTWGKGHKSRAVGDAPRTSVFIALDDAVKFKSAL